MTMHPDPKKWSFPVLGGTVAEGGSFQVQALRELSQEEQGKLAEYGKTAAHARNRFKLFAILRRNYDDWWKYTRSLLKPGADLVDDEMLELDRLLLNFQSAAKSLIDHFRQDWMQTYRDKPEEKQYQDFQQKLENGSWAYAFFQDLRNFTQNCGLPVCNYSRNSNANSVRLAVEADSEWLLDHYKKWDKSKLTRAKGRLNLIELTREYFHFLNRDFGNFVANAFAPNLIVVHNFFASLAHEVADKFPQAEFKIITALNINDNNMDFQFKTPPADLLGWIGINVMNKPLGANQGGENNNI